MVVANIAHAGAVSEAVDKQTLSQEKLNQTLKLQNISHQNYINLNKNILLGGYNHIFLMKKRNQLILNQLKVRSLKDE